MKVRLKLRFSPAVTVIILFGFISMFGDIIYESARGANGQYFNLLHINAAQIGLVFGIGEFLGYFLRLVSGVFSDRRGNQWLLIFLGYGMLAVVPLIGFTMKWNLLIVLILMERIGKALRSPAKDTILSAVAEKQVGIGMAFGLQEALDQIGAFIGPMIFSTVFFLSGENNITQYQTGYRLLIIPYVILMLFLVFAYTKIKKNQLITGDGKREKHTEQLQPIFWVYTAFTFFCTLGFVNFSMAGYHLKANHLLPDGSITMLYSVAMIVDALTALVIGKIYDRIKIRTEKQTGGILVLVAIPLLTMLLPIFVLSASRIWIVIGMIVFGIIMGTHETVMRSAIADITPFHKRGTGYGVFNTSYGLALLIGAAIMGWLYDQNQKDLIIALSCLSELIAFFLYAMMNRMVNSNSKSGKAF
jgi:MFS family permease